MIQSILLIQTLLSVSYALGEYKLCVPDSQDKDITIPIDRGEKVMCVRVTDSTDCAIRMAQGKVDFAVFNAEELLLANQFYPDDIVPLFQLKHKELTQKEFEFQSVALISKSIPFPGPGRGFEFLKNSGICLPGFSPEQWWNDYIMKYFEKKTYAHECQPNKTVSENEALNLKLFYGKACRPGFWATYQESNNQLKHKYPELCSLCDDKAACTYRNTEHHGHYGALDCLTSARGNVAYVALSHVREYFEINKIKPDGYQFLCPDGTVDNMETEKPCAWIKQPWDVIVASKGKAQEIRSHLKEWLFNQPNDDQQTSSVWIQNLKELLLNNKVGIELSEDKTSTVYLSEGREVNISKTPTCGKDLRWCTIGTLETNKCEWVAKEALALGIEPRIICHQSYSVFQCFRNIANNRADIMVIDSNYGHLARQIYNLNTVLYCEPEKDKNSEIVAVVRHGTKEEFVTNLNSLKDKKACFPEYGGIAWMSFVNVARTVGLFSSKSCDYPNLVANFFSDACTPGVKDHDHSNNSIHMNDKDATKLCSLCPRVFNSDAVCIANKSNEFYGDEGALRCLDGGADVAFVEAKNLNKSDIDRNRYQILCKNGSLSMLPGLDFDEICALSATIDSEVVSRKNNSQNEMLDISNALLKIQKWMGYRKDVPRPLRIYEKFNGTTDLLFKDSTSALVRKDSEKKTVLAYKELFSHFETCSSATSHLFINILPTMLILCLAVVFQ